MIIGPPVRGTIIGLFLKAAGGNILQLGDYHWFIYSRSVLVTWCNMALPPRINICRISCTRLILVQNCTQFRSRLPSRGPPCSRCPEAARVKDRPRCAIHSPKLNGEPCATLAQPWLPVWWHNSAEILQNSCRTSLRLHIRA
jgi:hypothetical protein